MDLTLTREKQKNISTPEIAQPKELNKNFKILDLNEAPVNQERPFEEILKGNVILQRDIESLTAELKELEAQINAEHYTLTSSNTYKQMIVRATRIRKDNGEALIKDGSTMATIRCHELLSNTQDAIKRSLTQLSEGQIDESKWKTAQRLLLEGEQIQTDVKTELDRLTNIENKSSEEKTAGSQSVNDLCTQLLSHSSLGNSSYFKRVIKAIKAFQKLPAEEKTAEATDTLYNALDTYIESRSKGGKKTSFKLSAGAKRMDLAKKLRDSLEATYYISSKTFADTIQESGNVIKELSIDKISENITKRVDKIASIPHPEIYESIQRSTSRYEEMTKLIINKEMLKPEYVRSHKADFQKYINLIKITKKYLDEDKSNISNKFGRHMQQKANNLILNYSGLEEYVELCNKNADENTLLKARSKISSFKGDPKNLKTAKTYAARHNEKVICQTIIIEAVKNMGPLNDLTADFDRAQILIEPWKINEKGEPATEEDMKIYKENLRYFSTALIGNKAEYLVAAKELFEKMITKDFFRKKDMDKSTWESSYQLQERSVKWMSAENILKPWSKVNLNDEFSQMFPELADKISDYLNMQTTLAQSANTVFNNLVGNLITGQPFDNEESHYELDEYDIEHIDEYYTKAQEAYKMIEKKYGDVFK